MVIVRCPDGREVTFPNVHYVGFLRHSYVLKTAKEGAIIAFVPLASGALIDFEGTCRVKQAHHHAGGAGSLRFVVERIREYAEIDPGGVADLKRALTDFHLTERAFR